MPLAEPSPYKPGYHAASTGRYQSYARLGTAYVHPFNKTCKAKELTHEDAINDGFDSLCEYIIELAHLNKGLTADTQVWIHPTDKVKS